MEQSSQTQSEILTQNVDLTQLADDDASAGILSPLPPYSPSTLRQTPWGRLMPCGEAGDRIPWELLPKDVEEPKSNEFSDLGKNGGVSVMGLNHLRPSEVFNHYVVGRSPKADFVVPKVSGADETFQFFFNWAYAMTSNQHFKIFCTLAESGPDVSVWVENSSGNGTLVNQTTLLRKGERRLLHSGDEICLVNPTSLRRKIRSQSMMTDIMKQFSFVFVRQQVPPSLGAVAVLPAALSSNFSPWKAPGSSRKTAVNARATNGLAHPKPFALFDRTQRRLEQDYEVRDLLGEGTAGSVRRAIHRQTGEARAVKVIRIQKRPFSTALPGALADVQAEAKILQGLSHPYIVKLDDFYVADSAVYLVMELLAGGDLFDRIVQKGRYTETESRHVMRRVLAAIHYLHEMQNVVHRDLKPENILLVARNNDVQVKLTDFGLAKTVNDEGCKTFCGTPQYFAPEVLRRQHTVKGRGRYGKPADMWSLGVILYVLLSGTQPFEDGQTLDFPDEFWSDVSQSAMDLVRLLLQPEPANRWTVLQACEHEWILTDDGDTHTHPLQDPALSVDEQRKDVHHKKEDSSDEPIKARREASEDSASCSSEETTGSQVATEDRELSDVNPAQISSIPLANLRESSSLSSKKDGPLGTCGTDESPTMPRNTNRTARVSNETEARRPLSPTSFNTRSESPLTSCRLTRMDHQPLKHVDELEEKIESFDDDESISSFLTTEEETKGLVLAAKREKAVSTGSKKRKRRRISQCAGDSLAALTASDEKQTNLNSWIKSDKN